jgi:hypothetical protein
MKPITIDYLTDLKARITASNIQGKPQALKAVETSLRLLKMGIPLAVKPGSDIFIIENRLFKNQIDSSSELDES